MQYGVGGEHERVYYPSADTGRRQPKRSRTSSKFQIIAEPYGNMSGC